MSPYRFIFLAVLLSLLAVSCIPAMPTATPPPILTEEPGIPVTGIALVQSVEIQILNSVPVQVNAIVRGQLPDGGCTTVSGVSQVLEGNRFKVTLTTTTDPLALCTLAATPFEQVVPLNIGNLPPAAYIVNVNGVEASFKLLPRDSSQFKQVLVASLNARDYNLLKALMHDSFTIGYWLSEGTTQSPDVAIEQLQRNLLSSGSLITADYSKNLIELLGTDPVTIVDPQLVDVNPLFIAGLGPTGRDEGILFTAKLPDGSLYWHGLLFAKDGFAKPAPVPATPVPVDMNAYPTHVKFVMALVDVRLRSGPGTQFGVLGYIAEGQTARVTGISADGNWWRVVCPDGSTGSCWVTAARHLTQPTDGIPTVPPPDYNAYPTSVKYVLAQRDVSIYSGPDTKFNVLGRVAAGQTAQVTGVNVNGSWWRVICPDGSTGSCWVSADSRLTTPTGLPGTADVQSVEIRVLESYPIQVNAIARGQLPDAGCTTISSVSQERSGNVIRVTLTTRVDPLALCAQVLTPFEQVIPLDVSHLLPGSYIVRVNGVEASFELPEPVHPIDVPEVSFTRRGGPSACTKDGSPARSFQCFLKRNAEEKIEKFL